MNFFTGYQLLLTKGIGGLAKAYWDQYMHDHGPIDPQRIQRLRMNGRFAPTFLRMRERVLATILQRETQPETTDDQNYREQATSFFQFMQRCDDIIANPKTPANLNCSVWLECKGSILTSTYFKLDIMDKDGKNLKASSTLCDVTGKI